MYLKRNAISDLTAWKGSPERKPMVLKGARQVGKTWLMKEFGRNYYEKMFSPTYRKTNNHFEKHLYGGAFHSAGLSSYRCSCKKNGEPDAYRESHHANGVTLKKFERISDEEQMIAIS